MPAQSLLLLISAAFMGGALNAVAGGGSFFSFPALLFSGVPAIPANATSAIALWPGSFASVVAYRKHVPRGRRFVLELGAASVLGGGVGALLLVKTPEATFSSLVPFLLLAATLLFSFGDRLRRKDGGTTLGPLGAVAVQFFVAVYGGYFGGGMGIVLLAAYALMGMRDIHEMNGLKSLMAVLLNGVANVTFMIAGVVSWKAGLPMILGAIAGGYGGAALAKRISPKWVRYFVIAVGWSMTVYFFVRK